VVANAMILGAIAAPLVVDLGEQQPFGIAGPYRLADADLGHRLNVYPGRQIADLELEPLRPVIVDQRRQQPAIGADREGTEAVIFLALGFLILAVDEHFVAAGRGP